MLLTMPHMFSRRFFAVTATYIFLLYLHQIIYLFLSLPATVLAGEYPDTILHYSFIPNQSPAFQTVTIGNITRIESPAFTVTGDSLYISVDSLHSDILIYLCRLDGSVAHVRHIVSHENISNICSDISEFKAETLYIVAQYRVDKTSESGGFIDISIEGVENKTVNDEITYFRTVRDKLSGINIDALESAATTIRMLSSDNKVQVPEYNFNDMKAQLSFVCSQLQAGNIESMNAIDDALDSLITLQRRILLSNPLIKGTTLFYLSDSESDAESGSMLKQIVLDVDNHDYDVLIDSKWSIESFNVNYKCEKIILSMQNDENEYYHLYEYNILNTILSRLTHGNASDFSPTYLPDDTVIFTSTRSMRFNSDTSELLTSLYRMEHDGANINRISAGIVNERYPSVFPDGRIVYSRHSSSYDSAETGGLFSTNPDGTSHALYWKGGSTYTGPAFNSQGIPTTNEILAVIGDEIDGTIVLFDRRKGMDASSSIIMSWPQKQYTASSDTSHTFLPSLAAYSDPYPLNKDFYLCCRSTEQSNKSDIWLIDRFGNEIQLHADPGGCSDPQPFMNRPLPPVIPARRKYNDENGIMYILNVYDSTDLEGVAKNEVKYLRIVETLPKHTGNKTAIGIRDSAVRRVLGTVPVESDGSVYFSLPPEHNISFQLLDSNGMMIQSMSSSIFIQSGEMTGCMGCHDNRQSAPPVAIEKVPYALLHEPTIISIPEDNDQGFSFYETIQPILSKSCIECHNHDNSDSDMPDLSADRTLVFNTAYNELWNKKLTGWEADKSNTRTTAAPYSYGSHASKLIRVLRSDHYDVKLSDDELKLLTTWIDLGAPYYSTYLTAYPGYPHGRSPFDIIQLSSLSSLTGISVDHFINAEFDGASLINIEHPEMSRFLSSSGIDELNNNYTDVITILRQGMDTLSTNQRADMPGFQPCDHDILDIRRAKQSDEIEFLNRAGIQDGSRHYDSD